MQAEYPVKVPDSLALSEGEQPIWYGRLSYKSRIGGVIFILILLIIGASLFFGLPLLGPYLGGFFIFLALVNLLIVFLAVQNSEYFLSSRRVFVRQGILSRASHDVKLEWVTGTLVRQGIFARALNYGDIAFNGVGGDARTSLVPMRGLSDVLNVKRMVDDTIESNRIPAEPVSRFAPSQSSPAPTVSMGSLTKTKYCIKCGSLLDPDAEFCGNCGAKVPQR
ncbi:MAG TPA: PH domain-containing protein [Nitrososphaerales archaeon]|nr:PH domain-containing protein [Nitrososphaerales archaeon]